jgi:hypothetical protein
MQQSNDLCFTELELAQTYGGVLILNLHLCLSRIAQTGGVVNLNRYSVRLLYLITFLMSLSGSRFLFRRSPFDTVGHYTRNALIIDAA